MEQIARDARLDSVEFRMRHLIQEGDPMANGQPWQSNGAKQVLRAHRRASALEEPGSSGPPSGKRRPRRCAARAWRSAAGSAGSSRPAPPCGSIPTARSRVLTGQVDIAGTNIALAQIAASAYGVDIDKVRITTGDTDVAPMTGLSAGSKTIYTVGAAVMQAAKDARQQTLEIAAEELEASVHDLEIEDGKVVVRGVPDKGITLASIGKKGNLYMSKIAAGARRGQPGVRPAGPGLRGPARADRGRSGHRRGDAARLRGRAGRRQGHQPARASRARCRAAPCRASASR